MGCKGKIVTVLDLTSCILFGTAQGFAYPIASVSPLK